ncbi:hypothetical protein [Xanthomonas albilineans]|uniref:hypothetical protein n=1 Tax=Xanthomonas albilineans TaxID=29447 RepID=UPI000A615B9F|nr:hypothetical protein [Xanthomonas albilineans]
MNKTETERAIEVMQAYVDGKEIEHRLLQSDKGWSSWASLTQNWALWNWINQDYRVKPEPRVIYVNEYPPPGNYGCYYESAIDAETSANPHALRVAVKYQEVIE